MRILLDECLPRPLRRLLLGHEVATAQERGWTGLQNGDPLRRAAADGFEVFLTMDKSIEFQQDVANLALAVVALRARSNDIVDLEPLIPQVLAILPSADPGQFVRVQAAARDRALKLTSDLRNCARLRRALLLGSHAA